MAGPITNALEQLQQHPQDQQAFRDLEQALQPFLEEMLRLVRRRRDSRLAPVIQTGGVISAALHGLFRGISENRFDRMRNSEDVRKVLTRIVLNRLSDAKAWNKRDKHAAHRTVHLDATDMQKLGVDPPPAEDELTELGCERWLERLLAVVGGVHAKAIDIVHHSVEGWSNRDIAAELGLSEGLVRKIKKTMHGAWAAAQES
jgi:DNA-directed RNA polymerase specialized sigma24 family protein